MVSFLFFFAAAEEIKFFLNYGGFIVWLEDMEANIIRFQAKFLVEKPPLQPPPSLAGKALEWNQMDWTLVWAENSCDRFIIWTALSIILDIQSLFSGYQNGEHLIDNSSPGNQRKKKWASDDPCMCSSNEGWKRKGWVGGHFKAP